MNDDQLTSELNALPPADRAHWLATAVEIVIYMEEHRGEPISAHPYSASIREFLLGMIRRNQGTISTAEIRRSLVALLNIEIEKADQS